VPGITARIRDALGLGTEDAEHATTASTAA